MILPDLEPTPDPEFSMFFNEAVAISQQRGLVHDETRKIKIDLKRGHINPEEFEEQNAPLQAINDELDARKKSIIENLPEELRDCENHFFHLLPAIREAVANIRDGKPDVHVAGPQGGNHVPKINVFKALLLGAKGTGYILTARTTEGGYIIARPGPGTSSQDVSLFVPAPQR